MTQRLSNTQRGHSGLFEAVMQKVSLIVSLVALGLMIGGLIGTLEQGTPLTSATAALPMSEFWHITQLPLGPAAMSAGIILLALLPSIRVVFALGLYLRRRKVVNALVALIVLLELLLSMWLHE